MHKLSSQLDGLHSIGGHDLPWQSYQGQIIVSPKAQVTRIGYKIPMSDQKLFCRISHIGKSSGPRVNPRPGGINQTVGCGQHKL